MSRQQKINRSARYMGVILTSLLTVSFVQAAERKFLPGQNVSILKLLSSKDSYHLTVGLGVLDSKIRNMGYFAYEQQGNWSALGVGSTVGNGARMNRLALKGEAFDDPQQPYENWLQGVKFDIFIADNTLGSRYQWQGAGVGMGIMVSPLSASVPIYLTLGADVSPSFVQFSSSSSAQYQWNSYQELEFFFTDSMGITLRHTKLSTGNGLSLDKEDEGLWLGLRWMF